MNNLLILSIILLILILIIINSSKFTVIESLGDTSSLAVTSSTSDCDDTYELSDPDRISYYDITSDQTVIVYAPWCGHCKRSMTDFKDAVSKSNGKVVMVSSDNKDSKQILKELKGKGYPHIAKGLHTSNPVEYKGDRTAEKIINFANN